MLTTLEQIQLKARNGRLEEALSERDRRLEAHTEKEKELTREKRNLESELLYVRRQLEALKRKLFGQSRSEQVSAAQ